MSVFSPSQALASFMRRHRLARAAQPGSLPTKNLTALAHDSAGRRVFLKCAPNEFDRGLQREQAALRFADAGVDRRALRVPSIVGADAHVLALSYIERAPTFYAMHRRRRAAPAQQLERIGRSLAALHQATSSPPSWATPIEQLLECFVWTRPDFATRLSLDGMRLLGTLQADVPARDGLISLLQAPQRAALIHGDAKALNVLMPARGSVVWLDWELAQWGDPAQDLGSFSADLTRCQLAPELQAEALTARQLKLALTALERGYAAESGPLSEAFKRRVQRWSGAHLLTYAHALVLASAQLAGPASTLLTHARHLLALQP